MTQDEYRNSMRCVAFHEAGHAVACVVKCLPFERVYIVPRVDASVGYEGMTIGRVVREVFKVDLAGKLEEGKAQVIQILAGPYAEPLDFPGLPIDPRSDLHDAESVLKFMLCKFTVYKEKATFDQNEVARKTPEIRAVFSECMQEVQALVEKNRDAITRVAEALLAKHNLTQAEVVALCQDSLPSTNPLTP